MLQFLGSRKTLCDGISRRELLQVGGLGGFGLGMSDLLRLQEAQASSEQQSVTFGRAKACIMLFLFGSPPQHETFDPKPDAPVEIQGKLKAVSTAVPGVQIGEGLPQIAKILDRVTVVRSLTHPFPLHGVPYAITGEPVVVAKDETKRDASRWPFIGSIVDYFVTTMRTQMISPSRATPSMRAAAIIMFVRRSPTASGCRAMPSIAALASRPMPSPAPMVASPAPIAAPRYANCISIF